MLPHVFLFLALLIGGIMGVAMKVSEVNKCNPTVSTAALFFWGASLLAFQSLVTQSASLAVPKSVWVTGLVFGSLAGVAFVAFLSGIKYGKIATSWLIASISPIVPSVASYVVYKEPLQATKLFSLLLILFALGLLFIDKRAESDGAVASRAEVGEQTAGSAFKWARLMAVVFLCASMATFGLKILAEAGLSGDYRSQYLFYWYVGGFLFAGSILVARRLTIRRREVIIGFLIAVSSVLSNVFLSLALEHRVPGYVAFPVAGIGSIFVVAAAGLFWFGERLTLYGYAGLGFGVLALAILEF